MRVRVPRRVNGVALPVAREDVDIDGTQGGRRYNTNDDGEDTVAGVPIWLLATILSIVSVVGFVSGYVYVRHRQRRLTTYSQFDMSSQTPNAFEGGFNDVFGGGSFRNTASNIALTDMDDAVGREVAGVGRDEAVGPSSADPYPRVTNPVSTSVGVEREASVDVQEETPEQTVREWAQASAEAAAPLAERHVE